MGGKTKAEALPQIQGHLLKVAREKAGMTEAEVALKLCLSKKSVIQLEEGGISTFFSEPHKVSVAKRVIALFNLDENQVLVMPQPEQDQQPDLPFDEPISVSQVSPTKASEKIVLEDPPKISLDDLSSGEMSSMGQSQERSPRALVSLALVVMVGVGFYFTQDAILGLFASDPKPVVSEVKNEEAPPPEPAATSAIAAVAAVPTCPKVEGVVPELKVFEPVKAGNFVFVQAKAKQIVCVADSSGKTNMQVLEAGSNFNFIGNAPFTVSSDDLSQVAIFYQGKSVRIDKAQAAVKLIETKLAALAAPTN